MAQVTQNTNPSTPRNYDKDPIVIIDRMPEISFLALMTYFFIALIVVLIFVPTKENLDWKYFAVYSLIMYGSTFIFLKNKITKVRTITCRQNVITREWNEKILEIPISNIRKVKKSFIDFYDSKQRVLPLYKPIYYLLTPLSIFLQHPTLVIIKYIYKYFKGFSNTSLYDTIIIFDQSDEMVSIFIPTNEQKIELQDYFLNKGYHLDSLPVFYTNMYSPDEITQYINKKDK